MTPIFFLVAYCVGLILTFARHPIYGLYTYLFAFYMAPSYTWWRNDVPDVRYLFIAAVVAVLGTLRLPADSERIRWYRTTPGKLLIALVVYLWIQTLWAIDREAQIEAATLFSKHLIVFYLFYRLADSVDTIKFLAFINVIGCAWFGYQALGASGGRLETIGGAVAGSNELGVHVSAGLIFGGILLLQSKAIKWWITFLTMPLIANCLVLTISRGAFLGFFAGGLSGYLVIPKRLAKYYLLFGILGLFLMSLLAHDALTERFTDTWNALTGEEEELDRSAASRMEIAQAGIRIGLDYPFGAGATATEKLSGQYLTLFEQGRAAHNTFAAVFAEHGFPGLAIYVLIILWVMRTMWSSRRSLDAAKSTGENLGLLMTMTGGALVAIYVSGNFSGNLELETQYWCLALLASTTAMRTAQVKIRAEQSTSATGVSVAATPGPASPGTSRRQNHPG